MTYILPEPKSSWADVGKEVEGETLLFVEECTIKNKAFKNTRIYADYEGVTFEGCSFDDVRFVSTLYNATVAFEFKACEFENVNFYGDGVVNIERSKLNRVNLYSAVNGDYEGALFEFDHTDVKDLNAYGCDCRFSKSNLIDCVLHDGTHRFDILMFKEAEGLVIYDGDVEIPGDLSPKDLWAFIRRNRLYCKFNCALDSTTFKYAYVRVNDHSALVCSILNNKEDEWLYTLAGRCGTEREVRDGRFFKQDEANNSALLEMAKNVMRAPSVLTDNSG